MKLTIEASKQALLNFRLDEMAIFVKYWVLDLSRQGFVNEETRYKIKPKPIKLKRKSNVSALMVFRYYTTLNVSFLNFQEVENSLAEDLSRELVEVSNSGRDIIEKEQLQPDAGDEISETLDALNRQVTDLEKGTRDKKDK